MEHLSDLQRREAIAACQKAFDAGATLGELRHTPSTIPVESDNPLIGADLRAHLREAQVVQREVYQLRNVAQQILHERNARQMRLAA